MENNENFETMDELETLQDNFKRLPHPAQAAAMGSMQKEHHLWPKKKKGKRVRPKRKSRKVSSRTAHRRKSIAELTKKAPVKKTTKKKRKSSGGFSVGQKLAIAAVGIAVVTIAVVKRP